MNAKTILFPTDFSEASDAALAYASSLARETGATLWIVHVEEPPSTLLAGELTYPLPEVPNPQTARLLEAVRPTRPDVAFQHVMRFGWPAEEIVQLAEEERADLIVMGTHGRTGLRRMIMGSVAEAVVRRAPCPVFTLKQPIGAEAVPEPAFSTEHR